MTRREEHRQSHPGRLVERRKRFHQLRPRQTIVMGQPDAVAVAVGFDLEQRHTAADAEVLLDPVQPREKGGARRDAMEDLPEPENLAPRRASP